MVDIINGTMHSRNAIQYDERNQEKETAILWWNESSQEGRKRKRENKNEKLFNKDSDFNGG